jgi:NAD dependent epimerase/dehydratase family enzyme
MKVIVAGGTGHLGRLLVGALRDRGDEVVVLSRRASEVPAAGVRAVRWDGRAQGPWAAELDGADAVINLAGRSVNCRYSAANLREMMRSRVDSTRAVGAAIARAARPPRVWLQMSTATIYAHRFDAANDEATGRLGGDEPGAPRKWNASVEIAREWERALFEAATPHTRRVARQPSPPTGSRAARLVSGAIRAVGGR